MFERSVHGWSLLRGFPVAIKQLFRNGTLRLSGELVEVVVEEAAQGLA